METDNEYVEVTQEIYNKVIAPWWRGINTDSEEYDNSVFNDPTTGVKTLLINGQKYRMSEVISFAVKGVREFGESVGVKM